jgi:Ion channel
MLPRRGPIPNVGELVPFIGLVAMPLAPSVLRQIASQLPRVYGVSYVLAIPVFALLYYFAMPSAFYAPYAHLEPAATDDLDRIGAMINGALHRASGSRELDIKGWELQSFSVYDPSAPDGTKFIFKIMAVFTKQQDDANKDKNETQRTAINVTASIASGVEGLKGPRPDETANIMRQANIEASAYPPSFLEFQTSFANALLPLPYPLGGRLLVLSRNENDELNQFFAGVQGNPIHVSGGFFRMLYFSATVITTIGFGDIVPMTPLARLFVALEGMSGVVIAGLFVSVAQRALHASR